MNNITITRTHDTPSGTFGVLALNGIPLAITLEQPWRNNAQRTSCIPPGTYHANITTSPRHGKCISIANVPNRTHILIHIGNTIKNTNGCILIGRAFHRFPIWGHGITSSRDALDLLFASIKGTEQITITITPPAPPPE